MRMVQLLLIIPILVFCSGIHAQLWGNRNEAHYLFPRNTIPEDLMADLLQEMMDRVKGKGFRYIGIKEDFFHGHLLYAEDADINEQGVMQPFAILYHTQEEASTFSKKTPGGPYDYLDRKTRNWIQFVQESPTPRKRIFNAYQFMIDLFIDTPDVAKSLEATRTHYTIFSEQLDHEKFPQAFRKKIVGTRQVDFYQSACELNSDAENDLDEEKIKMKQTQDLLYTVGNIRLNDRSENNSVCLVLQMHSYYLPEQKKVRPDFYEDGNFIVNNNVPASFYDVDP